MPYLQTEPRIPRHFKVYKGDRLVLSLEDTRGALSSTAAPPPSGAPTHPFVNARAHDTLTEGDLGEMLRASHSFDDYLARLIAAEHNVFSWNSSSVERLTQPQRIYREAQLVGAVAYTGGQFCALAHQPPYGALTFPHAMLCAYAAPEADALLACLHATETAPALQQALLAAGYTLADAQPY